MGAQVDFLLPGGVGPALGSLGLKGLLQCVNGCLQCLPLCECSGGRCCLLRSGLGAWVAIPVSTWTWLLLCGGVVSPAGVGAFCVSLCCKSPSFASSCVLCLVLKRIYYVREKSVLNNVLGGSLGSVIDDVLKGTL